MIQQMGRHRRRIAGRPRRLNKPLLEVIVTTQLVMVQDFVGTPGGCAPSPRFPGKPHNGWPGQSGEQK